MRSGGPSSPSTIVTNFKELAVNKAWHVEVFGPGIFGTMRVYMQNVSNLYLHNTILNHTP
jgi:hypothetical protein